MHAKKTVAMNESAPSPKSLNMFFKTKLRSTLEELERTRRRRLTLPAIVLGVPVLLALLVWGMESAALFCAVDLPKTLAGKTNLSPT